MERKIEQGNVEEAFKHVDQIIEGKWSGVKKKSKGSEVEDSVSAGLRNTEPPKQCFCIPE